MGIATAQITFHDLAGAGVIVDGPERAGNRTNLASDTDGIADFLGAGGRIDGDGFDRTGVEAPRFITLCAGIGDCG